MEASESGDYRAAKKLPSAVSVRNEQTIFNIHFE